MNTIVRQRVIKSIISVAVIATGATALARSTPGLAGQPYQPTDYQCFNNGAGAVWNSCANTVKTFCIALPVDSGAHDIQVTAFSPDSTHAISCQANAVDRYATFVWRSQLSTTPAIGTPSVIDLGTGTVPPTGALMVCCNMPDTTKLMTVNW
jgi:hypothetical protein